MINYVCVGAYDTLYRVCSALPQAYIKTEFNIAVFSLKSVFAVLRIFKAPKNIMQFGIQNKNEFCRRFVIVHCVRRVRVYII